MNQQLSEIKEALSKANLPYNYHEDTGDIYGPGDDHLLVNFIYHDEDAELILNAPQWLASLVSQVEEMEKIIDTAVMFLQSNELNIKAEQIKAMSQSLKGDKP